MDNLTLEATHSHLYPGSRGKVVGPLSDAMESRACQVTFSDGSAALGSLNFQGDGVAIFDTGPYTTAAGTSIPARRWRVEFTEEPDGAWHFRIRSKLPLD